MSRDEFTKLFKYIEEFRKEVSDQFQGTNEQFNKTRGQIDNITKLIVDYNQEMLMLAHKVDRLERWILEIAKKTGTKLSAA